MFHKSVAVSLLLRLLTVSASGEQNLKGGQLASVSNVNPFWNDLGREISIETVKGSESVSTTALDGDTLSGYAVRARYLDASCTSLASASFVPLNTCVFLVGDTGGGTSFTKYSFTSTQSLVDEYSDDTCGTLTTAGSPASYSTTCSENEKISVQLSLNPQTTMSTATFT
jgi:hypothetical protein